MMPGGVSGLELAREIRRRQPNLPVVLVTGYAEAAASMEDGKFGLLLKPYTLETLAEVLNAELGSNNPSVSGRTFAPSGQGDLKLERT